MKLRRCRSCNQHFDRATCACPHCGACHKTATRVGLALAAAGAIVASCGGEAPRPLYGVPIMTTDGGTDAG